MGSQHKKDHKGGDARHEPEKNRKKPREALHGKMKNRSDTVWKGLGGTSPQPEHGSRKKKPGLVFRPATAKKKGCETNAEDVKGRSAAKRKKIA